MTVNFTKQILKLQPLCIARDGTAPLKLELESMRPLNSAHGRYFLNRRGAKAKLTGPHNGPYPTKPKMTDIWSIVVGTLEV